VGPAQSAPGPRHDRHSVVKPDFTHVRPPFVCGRNHPLLISHFPALSIGRTCPSLPDAGPQLCRSSFWCCCRVERSRLREGATVRPFGRFRPAAGPGHLRHQRTRSKPRASASSPRSICGRPSKRRSAQTPPLCACGCGRCVRGGRRPRRIPSYAPREGHRQSQKPSRQRPTTPLFLPYAWAEAAAHSIVLSNLLMKS
jgi:hypothetical protein